MAASFPSRRTTARSKRYAKVLKFRRARRCIVAVGVTLRGMLRRPRASRVPCVLFLLGLSGCIDGVSFAKGVRPALPLGADEHAFAAEVAKDGGPPEATVIAALSGAKMQQSILDAMGKPAEAKPWRDYRPIFLTDKRIDDGIAFYRDNRALLERVGKEYGVPPEIIVAIIGVETSYGRITGKYRVLDALSTLAFHYPPRANFFRGELKQLFLLGDAHLAYPLDELKGSYAGAMGWGQFMPTSIAQWAKDEDGDGRIDLWNSLPDITASVGDLTGHDKPVRMRETTEAGDIDYLGQFDLDGSGTYVFTVRISPPGQTAPFVVKFTQDFVID